MPLAVEAGVYAIVACSGVAARLLGGWTLDVVEPRWVLAASLVFQALAMATVALALARARVPDRRCRA